MNIRPTLTIALLTVTLTACGGGDDTTVEPTTTVESSTAAAQPTTGRAADTRFFAQLTDQQLLATPAEEMRDTAQAMCGALRRGMNETEAVQILAEEGLTPAQSQQVFDAAVIAYCPDKA